MNCWIEIQYIDKDGDSIHSDFGIPESDARSIINDLLDEIQRKADFEKEWFIRCNGEE